MIYMSLLTIEDYADSIGVDSGQLPEKLGVDTIEDGDCIALLCGGKVSVLPKVVADDLRAKTGYSG